MTKKSFLIGSAAVVAGALALRELSQASNEDSLAGEVVFITGGSRGLGLALAREFARNGCRIAICARDESELASAVHEIRKQGANAFHVECDVSNKDEVDRAIAATVKHFGRIDILVNNAGIIQVGPVENFKAEDFELALDTIFWGTVHPTLAVLPAFLERGSGRIVNIGSIGSKLGIPHLAPYVSAKFAVAGFSQALAAEMKPRGIAVTAIYPGLMRTGSFVQAQFKGDQAKEADWFTLGANLPGLSMDPDRAARQIVQSIKRGDTERVLSFPAKAGQFLIQHLGESGTDLLGLITSTMLPKSKPGKETKSGRELWSNLSPAVKLLGTLGLKAIKNYNQRAKLSAT